MFGKLTEHLLRHDVQALNDATTHPFLEAAATSSLDPSSLKAWLAQDRLYAIAYVNFIGSLLSRVRISNAIDRERTLQWRITHLFIDSLINIRREIRLFEDTAASEGWLDDICGVSPTVRTRAYQDLFAGAASPAKPLIVGLAVLWATEEAYLRSWTHARGKVPVKEGQGEDGLDVMQRVFIPNWSSQEFRDFVRRIADLLDEYGGVDEVDDEAIAECETAYRQVLWAEREFWPQIKS